MSQNRYKDVTWQPFRCSLADRQREPDRLACEICQAMPVVAMRYDGKVAFGCDIHHEMIYRQKCSEIIPDIVDLMNAIEEIKILLLNKDRW